MHQMHLEPCRHRAKMTVVSGPIHRLWICLGDVMLLLGGVTTKVTEIYKSQTCDRGKKAMIDHLKNLTRETQNINESKINLDS